MLTDCHKQAAKRAIERTAMADPSIRHHKPLLMARSPHARGECDRDLCVILILQSADTGWVGRHQAVLGTRCPMGPGCHTLPWVTSFVGLDHSCPRYLLKRPSRSPCSLHSWLTEKHMPGIAVPMAGPTSPLQLTHPPPQAIHTFAV